MNRTQKAEFVDQLSERLSNTPFLALADFRGASVARTNELRRELEKDGIEIKVVKNTLTKRAIAGTAMEGLGEHLSGMTGLVLCGEDPVASAKAVRDKLFAKDSPMAVKAGYFDGEVLSADGVKAVADLPSKEELQVMLLQALQAAPRKVMGVIRAPARDLVYLLKNYENKLAEGEGDE
jgi:large subunit ribosomal protein L10